MNRHPVLDLVNVTGATVDVAGINLTPGQARVLAQRLTQAARDATTNAARAEAEAAQQRELEASDRAHPAVTLAAEAAGVPISDVLKLRGPRQAAKVAQLIAWAVVTIEGRHARDAAAILGRSTRQAQWMAQRWPAIRKANPDLADLERRFVHDLARYRLDQQEQLWLPL